jgi:hypothetical protein
MKKSWKIGIIIIFIILILAIAYYFLYVRPSEINENIEKKYANLNERCSSTKVVATEVSLLTFTEIESGSTAYSVKLYRETGEETIGGVYLVFNDEYMNFIKKVEGNIALLNTKTAIITFLPSEEMVNPHRLGVSVYFLDNSGNEMPCDSEEIFLF